MKMKRIARKIARRIFRLYPIEYGKYTILQKLFFPYLAPNADDPRREETVRMPAGFWLRLDPREFLHASMYLFCTYEMPTVKFLRCYIKQGDTAVNIGANIGYMALVMSRCVGNSGKAYAIEPEQTNFQRLQTHLELNRVNNTQALQYPVSNADGELTLYLLGRIPALTPILLIILSVQLIAKKFPLCGSTRLRGDTRLMW